MSVGWGGVAADAWRAVGVGVGIIIIWLMAKYFGLRAKKMCSTRDERTRVNCKLYVFVWCNGCRYGMRGTNTLRTECNRDAIQVGSESGMAPRHRRSIGPIACNK